MPLLVLFVLALTIGFVAGLAAWRYPRIARTPPRASLATARKVGEAAERHRSLRAILSARLDPAAATGLALTLALVFVICGGVLLGVLASLVRTNSDLIGIDTSVAKWGNLHASTVSMHVLNVITQLGSIYTVGVLCVILAAAETIRERSVWVTPFIIAVVGGEGVLIATVKQLVGRLRPAFNPAAASLGPAFPSGHSAAAAAFYATAALLLSRRRSRRTLALLTGLAAGVAVAVAESRVLLDLHWLTDVIAGLVLGWAWFTVCAIAFGGRILRFGAAAEVAAQAADATGVAEATSDSGVGRAVVSAQSPDAAN